MKTAYSVSKAQSNLPRVLKEAEDHVIAITRRDETIAYLISKERLESLIESLELMSNPKAMKAIRDAKAGRTKYLPLSALDED
ncbi:MAG: type II toxin-antitoxin system Phd/YefM family antitoxin [Verrucomicrobiota bacterium]